MRLIQDHGCNSCDKTMIFIIVCSLLLLVHASIALADKGKIIIAKQYGIGYLPLIVAEHEHLIQKNAIKAKLGHIEVQWATLGGGAAVTDALLSGSIDIASGGPPSLLTLWDRTHGKVKGIVAFGSLPRILTTINPKIKSIKDFGPSDRIALPSIKISGQAVILEMAAAEVFGKDHYAKLDTLTVSMKHPDALAALLSGRSQITAHFTNPPYQNIELKNPGFHEVLSSYSVTKGPLTLNLAWTTEEFRKANPKLYGVFFNSMQEAIQLINAYPARAAKIFLSKTKIKQPASFIESIVTDPDAKYTVSPQSTFKFARFMYQIGDIKTKPKSWKDYFFPEVYKYGGS